MNRAVFLDPAGGAVKRAYHLIDPRDIRPVGGAAAYPRGSADWIPSRPDTAAVWTRAAR